MAISANEMKTGQAILIDGELHIVLSKTHTKPGKGGAFIQAKLKRLVTGQVLDQRFRSVDKVETAFLEKKTMQYSYTADGQHWFMDPETFEQVPIAEDLIGDAIGYLHSGTPCEVQWHEGKAIAVELPNVVEMEVKDTPPALKGATVTNQYKEAVLDTGITVQVPPFIEPGERIRVDTRSGEYVERVK